MRLFKRILAIFIACTLIISTVPPMLSFVTQKVNAAAAGSVTVKIANNGQSIAANDVTLTWQQVSLASSYDLGYYDAVSKVYRIQNIPAAVVDAVYQVDNLTTDFVYNFTVDAKAADGSIISSNNKRILTGISMDVSPVDETAVRMNGGGYEVGIEPQLKFRIKIPTTYTGTTVSNYAYDKIDYDINMNNNVGGTLLDRIKVRYSSKPGVNQYIATTYGSDNAVRTVAAQVYTGDLEPGYMNFTIKGQNANSQTDISTTLPDNSTYNGAETGFDSSNKAEDIGQLNATVNLQKICRDIQIAPSMAIRMSILPKIHDATDINSAAYLQSTVLGGYVSTPIRFQINKDSSNNMIANIFRVNQGTSFTYELHASPAIDFPPPPLPQKDNIIAVRNDKDAGTSNTIRVYVEKQSNNSTYYFKVVAWDSSGDTLTSSPIGYAPSQDSPLAPLPEGFKVLSVTQTTGPVTDTFYTVSNAVYNVKSADVKFIWNKPSNYSDLFAGMSSPTTVEDAVYYHLMISSFPDGGNIGDKERFDAMFGDVLNPSKEYTVTDAVYKGYRKVYNVDLTACEEVDAAGKPTINGSYLSFTMKGLSLFSNLTGALPGTLTQDLTLNNDKYPTYLLPNRIYYAKMYTTKGTAPQSDNSLAVSFTTPLDAQKSPAAPNNFKLIDNKIDTNSNNYVKLEWNKISFNLSDYTANTSVSSAVYYDLYISDSMDTNSFIDKIGSGEQNQNSPGDVLFTGLSNLSTVVDATVSRFSSGKFSPGLNPNTTYYFAVKTRVSIGGVMQSSPGFSQILSVTTTKGDIIPPDSGKMIPKAPLDFRIAVDGSGNKVIDSTSVTLKWNKLESDVKYILIQTAAKIDSNITVAKLEENKVPFTELLLRTGEDENEAKLDGIKFIYNSVTKEFTYNVSGLMPNTVYYYSLRAVRTDIVSGDETDSIWVSLPVTTTLIEAPDLLSVVKDNQVGFWWDVDNTAAFATSDSYNIKAFENGSTTAVSIPRAQVFVSKVVGAVTTRYFARVVNLKKNTKYNFEVTGYKAAKVVGTPINVNSNQTGDPPMFLQTSEDKHEIDVKWKGKDGYSFELAVKGETDIDYTVLKEGETGKFIYLSKEKPVDLVGTNFTMYYARIRTTDGTTPLKSNSKYYIKVRGTKSLTDADNNTINNTSKYIGPVNTRTEYSQKDYDDNEQGDKENASYADQVKKFKEALFWEMGNDSGIYKIKYRKDRVENFIKNDSGRSFVIDFTTTTRTDITRREVYLPLTTAELLVSRNENLVIRVPGSEFTIKPGTIDYENTGSVIADMKNNSSVLETYIYIDINKLADSSGELPAYTSKASDIQTFSVMVKGTNVSELEIEQEIKTKLDGLITTGLASLQGTDKSYKDTSQKLNDEINSIVAGFETTLKIYIRDYIEGSSSISSKIQAYNDINSFSQPLSVKMSFNNSVKGNKTGYVYTDSNWLAKTSLMSNSNSTVTFDTLTSGDYAILSAGTTGIFNIPDGHWAQKDIDAFTSKYDIRDIFQSEYYTNVDNPIALKDTVLVIEKVLSVSGKSSSSTAISSKAKELGIDGTINFTNPTRNVTRQELASLLMRVYKIKSGVDPTNMKASKTITINDESSITKSHYKEVEMCIDLKILSIDDKKNFRPNETCSKAQTISSLTRMLKILGEL